MTRFLIREGGNAGGCCVRVGCASEADIIGTQRPIREVESANDPINLDADVCRCWAIHIAAISQLCHSTEGRAYYDRKIAEGKTTKEAIRALKRRISDRVYRHLITDTHRARLG